MVMEPGRTMGLINSIYGVEVTVDKKNIYIFKM